MIDINFSNIFTSKESEIEVYYNDDWIGKLQGISFYITRPKIPIYSIQSVASSAPIGKVKGKTTITGTFIFDKSFDKYKLQDKDKTVPFNVHITKDNCTIKLINVEVINEGCRGICSGNPQETFLCERIDGIKY